MTVTEYDRFAYRWTSTSKLSGVRRGPALAARYASRRLSSSCSLSCNSKVCSSTHSQIKSKRAHRPQTGWTRSQRCSRVYSVSDRDTEITTSEQEDDSDGDDDDGSSAASASGLSESDTAASSPVLPITPTIAFHFTPSVGYATALSVTGSGTPSFLQGL